MYSRVVDDQVLTLSSSGWTYRSTFVLFDYETESLWYHLPGTSGLTAISGFYADRRLQEFESVHARWDRWLAQHPGTAILK